jgi:hypothetical protein
MKTLGLGNKKANTIGHFGRFYRPTFEVQILLSRGASFTGVNTPIIEHLGIRWRSHLFVFRANISVNQNYLECLLNHGF